MSSKPKLLNNSYWDYNEVIDYIEEKYGIDTRDYAKSNAHFPNYLNKFNLEKPNYPNALDLQKGLISKEEYDARFADIHNQYKEYQEWCIENPEPEYLDFWHWILDLNPHISNGSHFTLDTAATVKNPSWINDILGKIYEVTESRYVAFSVEW